MTWYICVRKLIQLNVMFVQPNLIYGQNNDISINSNDYIRALVSYTIQCAWFEPLPVLSGS